jgi:hypothetical protein
MHENVQARQLARDIRHEPGESHAVGDAQVSGKVAQFRSVVVLAEQRRADDSRL